MRWAAVKRPVMDYRRVWGAPLPWCKYPQRTEIRLSIFMVGRTVVFWKQPCSASFARMGAGQIPGAGASVDAPVLYLSLSRIRAMMSQVAITALMIAGCLAAYVWVIPPPPKPPTR
jgi:hypothetical protein